MTDLIDTGIPILEEGEHADLVLTDTTNLQLPINCIMAGDDVEPMKREVNYRDPNYRKSVVVKSGGRIRVGPAPSFTVTTGRGYD